MNYGVREHDNKRRIGKKDTLFDVANEKSTIIKKPDDYDDSDAQIFEDMRNMMQAKTKKN